METRPLRFIQFLTLSLLATAIFAAGCRPGPVTELKSKDIPVGVGTEYEAFQNTPGGGAVPVKIEARGPWDFTQGPALVAVKSRIIGLKKAVDSEAFPGATYAEQIIASDYTGGSEAYNFAALSAGALESFGQSVKPKGRESIAKRFTKSERLLVFPMRVGDKWTDTMSIDGDAGSGYTVDKEVIARGEVKVPAGVFFDCFMVRITKTAAISDGTKTKSIIYAWWAPGVGLVAAAGGRPDDENIFFTDAVYLFRLKSYKVVN